MPNLFIPQVFILIFSSLVFGCLNIYACSCRPTPSLLEAFDTSEVVVAAKLIGVTNFNNSLAAPGRTILPTATMIVEKAYKGNTAVGEKLNFHFGGSNCDFYFDQKLVGSKYLLYLEKPGSYDPTTSEPSYRLSFCGRSSIFSRAIVDLAYLDNMGKYRGRSRVSGILTVPKAESAVSKRSSFRFPSVGGVLVSFIGRSGKVYTTISLENGMFELYDLPPDEYEFRADLPAGWKLNAGTFLIRERQHSDVWALVEPDTQIYGKVLSPNGRPVAEISVKALRVDRAVSYQESIVPVSTDRDGSFEIDNLMPGVYRVVANGDFPFDYRDAYFKTAFFPRGVSEADAKLIKVELGKPVKGIVITLSKRRASTIVSGFVKYADGKPASNALVTFSSDTEEGSSFAQTKTDEGGRFRLSVLKGVVGSFLVLEDSDHISLNGCDTSSRSKKDPITGYTEFLRTNNVEINTSKTVRGIRLTFPFASCPKP